jgi:hypothetical protein
MVYWFKPLVGEIIAADKHGLSAFLL